MLDLNYKQSVAGTIVEVNFTYTGGVLSLEFSQDEFDRERVSEWNFGMNEGHVVSIHLGSEKRQPHEDLIALSCILIINPFVGKELRFNFPVSNEFIDAGNKILSKYKLFSNSAVSIPDISGQERSGAPLLAFSGGADSTAALAVMPSNTIPVFMLRSERKKTLSLYDSSAPLSICHELSEVGYNVKIVESDLEYIRNPVGFPTDLANAIPAILLSESLESDSISFGTVLESGYGIGHSNFIEYGQSSHWRFFSTLFSSVGLQLSLPTLGISEVGTAKICEESPNGKFSQSCIRSSLGNPCDFCWKCFRKKLLLYSIGAIESPNFVQMLESNEIQKKLSEFPISHENVIVYSMQRINLEEHPYFKPIVDKLDMSLNLEMLDFWYSGSIDFVPDRYRHKIRDKIIRYLPIMNPHHESIMESWDMNEHLGSPKALRGQERLTSFWQDLSQRFG